MDVTCRPAASLHNNGSSSSQSRPHPIRHVGCIASDGEPACHGDKPDIVEATWSRTSSLHNYGPKDRVQ